MGLHYITIGLHYITILLKHTILQAEENSESLSFVSERVVGTLSTVLASQVHSQAGGQGRVVSTLYFAYKLCIVLSIITRLSCFNVKTNCFISR